MMLLLFFMMFVVVMLVLSRVTFWDQGRLWLCVRVVWPIVVVVKMMLFYGC